MSIDTGLIIMVSLIAATLFVSNYPLFFFNKIARLLKGGKGWGLFKIGIWMYLAALIIYGFRPDPIGGIISNIFVGIGTGIFLYALVQIRRAIVKAIK